MNTAARLGKICVVAKQMFAWSIGGHAKEHASTVN